MKSVYLASPFFSPAQKERIAKVKAALSNNKTIDPKIFLFLMNMNIKQLNLAALSGKKLLLALILTRSMRAM